MKIAFFYSSFFRHGGIQRVVANIVNEFSKYHEVELICNEKINIENNPYNIKLEKVKVTYLRVIESRKIKNLRLAFIVRLNKIFKRLNLEYLQKYTSKYYYRKKSKMILKNYINSGSYDVVIGCSISFNMLLGSIKEQINCKSIGWENNSFESYFENKNPFSSQKIMCKSLLNKLDKFIVLTENDHKAYKQYLNLDSMIINNPLSFTSDIKSQYNNKTILSVGRLEHNKGFDLLLNIFEKFSLHNREWNLKIIGEGPIYSELNTKIKSKNLNDKVFIEPYTNNIKEEYLNSDIYISTARYESFGLTVLEAMECGLPIVTFNTVGPTELVKRNECGIVIRNYDTDEYCYELNKLANDIELIKLFGYKGITAAKQYEIKNILQLWNQALIT